MKIKTKDSLLLPGNVKVRKKNKEKETSYFYVKSKVVPPLWGKMLDRLDERIKNKYGKDEEE